MSRRKIARTLAALVMVLVLAACGQSPSIVLTLDSATAELLRGSDVQVIVTLTRAGGASADVALSVTGLPANVDADFSPVTLSGAELSSTLTLTATEAAVEGDYAVTVTGTGTGLADSADLTLEVIGLAVSGRVVSLYDLPVAGIAVRSQGDSAITDANGTFALSGLSVPYDLAIWNAADEWVQIYAGLTSEELVLAPVTATAPTGTPRSAPVSGSLSGGVIPVGPNQMIMVCAEGVDGIAIGCDNVAPTESAYSFEVQWIGGATQAIKLHALQMERDGGGYPTAYQGYASMDMNLTDTVPTVANLDLGDALATTTVTVDVDSPVAILGTFGAVQVGPNLAMPVMLVNGAVTAHEALMPVIGDSSYTFAAAAAISQFGWQADVTGSSATVTVPAAPQLIAPADTATGVTTATNFSANNPAGGPMTYMWNATDLVVGVTTMDSTTTIPDVSEFGLTLPANAAFTWQVIGQSGTSADDGTHAIGDYYNFLLLLSQSSPGPRGTGTFAITDGWGFTTAP
ncbi:MAG TPA: hypothetical protein VKZ43_01295 [Trueperaceae bacterium]|nr:hypothetical protein [Trueperaceae bacterium]